jgi:hypothetical protein
LAISTDARITLSINPVGVTVVLSLCGQLDPDSNVSEVSDPHRRKQDLREIYTDAGITISINPVSPNVHLSIRDNLDPDSNVSDVNDPHQ